jgi:uncharacterized protein (TIGR02246 family)
MTRDDAERLLRVYGRAWETRDPDLILSIFTPDATYHDPGEPVRRGHEGIRAYWMDKVVGGQRDIAFDLRHVWIDGDTVIAEWHARLTDTRRKRLVELREVGIFSVRGGKFDALREYYAATVTRR